jgi:DNA polymerase-1
MSEEEYDNCIKTQKLEPFMRQKLVDFNLGSRKQIGEYLIDFGWKPERFTPTGQPIVDEKTLSAITHIHEANLIAQFLLLQKRIAQIDSWIEATEDDGRVHGFVIPNGAITGRMTHRNPNMAQVPAVYSPYGKECRACWTVEEGNVLIGVDASGLEIRMLAHYMDDEEYTNEILNGDIHTANQKLAKLESRDKAKTFIYALMYGAGDEKLGSVVGGNTADGKRARQYFFDNKPTFKSLRDRVQRASTKKYLKGLDGRKLYVRNQHSALNTLLQGAGAIVMKQALVLLDEVLKLNDMEYKFVANIHDEWQIEAPKCHADKVGKLAVDSIIKAGTFFNLRCPLDGEYKIGGDWSETH